MCSCLLVVQLACSAGPAPNLHFVPRTGMPPPQSQRETAADHSAAAGQSPTPGTPGIPAAIADFERRLASHRDLTYTGLVRALSLVPGEPDAGLGFDPTAASYFARVKDALKLTPDELALFRAQGVVSVDHVTPYSMGSAYYAIYTRDLPVLVTTDSVLHAFHRSFDNALQTLEVSYFAPAIADVLERGHATLAQAARERAARGAEDEAARDAFADVDLYLTVARNLLAGAAEPGDGGADGDSPVIGFVPREPWDGSLLVRSALQQDAQALSLLRDIASLRISVEDEESTPIYGSRRLIDFSQFRPRGHYTRSQPLQRYFRAMMWLGRADTGFSLVARQRDGGETPVARQRRAAALLSRVIARAGAQQQLARVAQAIDFMVGVGTAVSPGALDAALADAAGPDEALLLPDDARIDAALRALAARGLGAQRVRSQGVISPGGPQEEPVPDLFQVFGQRFTVDGFALSKLVFDSIRYENKVIERFMPSGLDVAAVLGNDAAVPLLQSELERWRYAANLLAARETFEAYTPVDWAQSVYNRWLSTLRALDDAPAGPGVPALLSTRAWQHKQLQTQLASWSQLRHDTILYAKQSYTAIAACEYPMGYVEPYPEVYRQLSAMAAEMARVAASVEAPASRKDASAVSRRPTRLVDHFARFAETMATLQRLAEKELAAEPFSEDEAFFLKQTIDVRGGGSGAPTYSGWYPQLIFGEAPNKFRPTVADVHTDPNTKRVLEVANGRVNFLMAAIDNQGDRAVYVGPVFSYYEFRQDATQRMTDEQWEARVRAGDEPARPQWTESFQPPRRKRRLDRLAVPRSRP